MNDHPERLPIGEDEPLPGRIGIARQDTGSGGEELRTCWAETAEKLASAGFDAAVYVREESSPK